MNNVCLFLLFCSETKLYIPADLKNVYQLNERIVTKNDRRSYNEIPLLIKNEKAIAFEKQSRFSTLCPPGSKRNPSHVKSHTRHLLENGSLYHIIVPRLDDEWQIEGPRTMPTSIKAFRAKKSISGICLDTQYIYYIIA